MFMICSQNMNAQTPILSEPAASAEAFARPVIERQMLRLERLAGIGMEIAEAVGRQASGRLAEDETPVTEGDVVAAYARVSRAVRLTDALLTKAVDTLRALDRRVVEAEGEAAAQRDRRRESRKDRVEQIVARQIRAEHEGEPRDDVEELIARLMYDVGDDLDHEIHGDILARPVSDLVAAICRELKLSPDWSRLADEGWARDEIGSGQAGDVLKASKQSVDVDGSALERLRVRREPPS
jgi:hypothetical protein